MDFNFENMDSLAALRPVLRTVEYKGITFYVRSLSAAAEKELMAKTALTGEITATKLERYYSELTRVIIMNGLVNAKGEQMLVNEKQYKKFIEAVDNDLVQLLEGTIHPVLNEEQQEQSNEQKK
ncbi:hypothetical protein ACW5WN_01300 [Aeromonas lacus]|uniref:hypothetical protein n=1 Tax=Aeromonas lacus TaxID=558884 RepID=UPI00051BBCAD|nr:hypothetical protein [Aeromonas lacus]